VVDRTLPAQLRLSTKLDLALFYFNFNLPPTKEEVYVFVRTPEFVCLSVCPRLLKNACMDLDEMLHVDRCRDMDGLTFEPDPDHSSDAEPDSFLRYRIGYGTLQPCL